MPSRWLVPLAGIDLERVTGEQVHSALTRWFDLDKRDHNAQQMPYALSPMRETGGLPAVEVRLLSARAEEQFATASVLGVNLRLGGLSGASFTPRRLRDEAWRSLATPSGATSWVLDFVTPATFRRGTRSTPWPAPSAVLRGLTECWAAWSGLGQRDVSHQQADEVWVSDIDGRSHPVVMSGMHLSGFVGRIRYRCDDKDVARLVDPLFRLAEYSGIGTGTAKGLGVTRVVDARPAVGTYAVQAS